LTHFLTLGVVTEEAETKLEVTGLDFDSNFQVSHSTCFTDLEGLQAGQGVHQEEVDQKVLRAFH